MSGVLVFWTITPSWIETDWTCSRDEPQTTHKTPRLRVHFIDKSNSDVKGRHDGRTNRPCFVWKGEYGNSWRDEPSIVVSGKGAFYG